MIRRWLARLLHPLASPPKHLHTEVVTAASLARDSDEEMRQWWAKAMPGVPKRMIWPEVGYEADKEIDMLVHGDVWMSPDITAPQEAVDGPATSD